MKHPPAALVARRAILRTSRSPLGRVWARLYEAAAQSVARRATPDAGRASVYAAGSVASGEPLYGLSDIDLVVIADDEAESAAAQARYRALCRRRPGLQGLIPHFWPYSQEQVDRTARGPYPVLAGPEAVFVGPRFRDDPMALLERPGLAGAGSDWRLLRGRPRWTAPGQPDPGVTAWLELHHRWRYALLALANPGGDHAASHCARTIADAARIWLFLARGELLSGSSAPLRRAFELLEDEREGLAYALELRANLHRMPRAEPARTLPCFVRLSALIAEVLDERSFAAGSTEVELIGGGDDPPPLVDWRTLATPATEWRVVQGEREAPPDRLLPLDDDPADAAVLARAAALAVRPDVPVLRRGNLLLEPTYDVWGAGRLRLVQCRSTDPVSTALLEGSRTASFPEAPGWSLRDRARRAVAEHRAWLAWDRGDVVPRFASLGPQPSSTSPRLATIDLLLAAARAALLLESVEHGTPRLVLGLPDVAALLAARSPAAASAVAAAQEQEQHEDPNLVDAGVVAGLRAEVLALTAYAG